MKIVILDGFGFNPGDLDWSPIAKLGNLTVYPRTPKELVVERSKDAEAVLCNKIAFTKDVLAQLPHLRYIGECATGFNNIDIEYARTHGICVSNVPNYSTPSVAQLVFAHLLNVTHRVSHYASQNREGRWSRTPDFCYWDSPLVELDGKQFGIYGMGNIGCAVAAIAQSFGMKVIAFTSKSQEQLTAGIQKVDFPTLLGRSDVLSLHCPLTKDTHLLMNKATLALMKLSAILINTARGGLIDENAVAAALDEGRLGAFAADVLTSEPPSADNPLLSARNAFITPHIGWATLEARQRLMQVCCDNLVSFIQGKPQNNVAARRD